MNWQADEFVWFGWIGLFLALELLALTGHVPWTTLSEFAWSIEGLNGLFRWAFLVGLAALLVHIVGRFP